MSETVFILGAGASKDCGAPLMDGFLDISSSLLSRKEVEIKRADFERVFRAISSLQTVHSKAHLDLNNIESIFTALEIAKILGKLPGFKSDEIPEVIASLKELIVITLEKTIRFPTEGRQINSTSTYGRFAELLTFLNEKTLYFPKTSVITFNYDIALDVAMFKSNLGPDYGFNSEVDDPCFVKLLKLHGSLNWAVRMDNKEVLPLTMQEYFSRYFYDGHTETSSCAIPIGSQLKKYFADHKNIEVKPEPIIVPPAWNKSDYHQLLSTIWSNAAKELEEAENIFIIGYSLPETDMFFRLLFGLGSVGEKLIKKIIVYNPDTSGITEDRFTKMLGPGSLARFKYKPLKFREACDDIEGLFT